ncbi:MAG TPA: acyl-CoA dehydrogenase family protein, partial [Syntrophales bacterium]|nr:acyl-CoA dehydrogenase family protein [Syntrophales bacterium]
MNFELTEIQRMIQETARNFARNELEPVAAKLDETDDRETFLKNLKKLADLGLMGINVKADYGGSEAGVVSFSLAMTEIGRACASTGV